MNSEVEGFTLLIAIVLGLAGTFLSSTTPHVAMTHFSNDQWDKYSDEGSELGKLFGYTPHNGSPEEYKSLYVSKDAAIKAASKIKNDNAVAGAITVHKYSEDDTICSGNASNDGSPCVYASSDEAPTVTMPQIAETLKSKFHITPLNNDNITQLHGESNILNAVKNGTTFKNSSGKLVNCGIDYTATSTNTGGVKNITIHAVYCLNGSDVSQINAS